MLLITRENLLKTNYFFENLRFSGGIRYLIFPLPDPRPYMVPEKSKVLNSFQLQSVRGGQKFFWRKSLALIMARPLRAEFPGAIYHVTSSGNARLPIWFVSSWQAAVWDHIFT